VICPFFVRSSRSSNILQLACQEQTLHVALIVLMAAPSICMLHHGITGMEMEMEGQTWWMRAAPPLTAHEKWRRLLNMLEWTAQRIPMTREWRWKSTKLVRIYAPAMRFKLCHLMCHQKGGRGRVKVVWGVVGGADFYEHHYH